MKKQKKLTGPEWIRLKKAVESWEKEDMAFHSTDYLKELSQKVEAGPPTYSPRTPKQNEYYQAYSYVKKWINRWERFQAFDDLKGRGTWHKWQLKKCPWVRSEKTSFRNPKLHEYKVAHFMPGKRYNNEIEYLILSRPGGDEDQVKFIYSFDYGTFCQECGGILLSFDEVRSESFCPQCGLVKESFKPEEIRYKAYLGPHDSDNLGRNATYGGEYSPKDWRKPRRESNRPDYEGRYYLDRLRDSLDTKSKSPIGPGSSIYNKELEIRVKMAGFGSIKYKWWDLKRRRPPRKNANETDHKKEERQSGERDKKRIQRLNKWLFFLQGYCNENQLPAWVYNEVTFILKKMPAKFSMNNIHSRLDHEKIIIGLVLYVIQRTFPKHHLISDEMDLTSAEFEIIKRNLAKLYNPDSMPLYDKRATY